MGLDELPNSEGVPLGEYTCGERAASMWTSLVGRDAAGAWELGVRNNGIKVIRDGSGAERVFDVTADPAEATDLAASQPPALIVARQLLGPEQVALEKLQ